MRWTEPIWQIIELAQKAVHSLVLI